MTEKKDPSDTKNLIKFYKTCVHEIHKHMKLKGTTMTKKEVDKEIKINAHFPFESCTDPANTIEEMQNLIAWAFVYGDQQGKFVDYPQDKLDELINLNF